MQASRKRAACKRAGYTGVRHTSVRYAVVSMPCLRKHTACVCAPVLVLATAAHTALRARSDSL
eukprot:3574167-Pleurochrysis_carterae.AAC.2